MTAPTDAQLRDQAVTELEKTTVGYVNSKWKVPPAGTRWKAALDLLAQIGGVPPPPPPALTGWGWDASMLPAIDPAAGAALVGYAGPPGYLYGTIAVAYPKATDPAYAIHAGNLDPQIRIPHGTLPGLSYDKSLVVVDMAAGREHSMEHAAYNAATDTWTAGGGSSVPIGATNELKSGKSNDSSGASRIPLLRGAVTPQMIIDGVIPCTLRIRIAETQVGPPPCPYPANTSYGGINGVAGHATFGWMFAPAPGTTPAQFGLPKLEAILASAIIAHGCVLTDGGQQIVIDATDPINGGPTWADAGVTVSAGAIKLNAAMTGFWKSLRRVGPVPVLTP